MHTISTLALLATQTIKDSEAMLPLKYSDPPKHIIIAQHELSCFSGPKKLEGQDDSATTIEHKATSRLETTFSEYILRINEDSESIWESKEMTKHFPLIMVRRIRLQWKQSTRTWLCHQLKEVDEESFDLTAFQRLYLSYISPFQRLTDAMVRKRRETYISIEMVKFSKVSASSPEEALLKKLPLASASPVESLSLIFNLVQEQPHNLLSLQNVQL